MPETPLVEPPDPLELRRRCREVQATWTPQQELSRRVVQPEPVETRVAELPEYLRTIVELEQ